MLTPSKLLLCFHKSSMYNKNVNNFLVPPKVNPKLRNQSLSLSSAFDVKCILDGVPHPEVNWTKNGAPLQINNNTLRIVNVTFKDAGQYVCIAESRAGKINISIWIDVTGKIS